MQKVPRLNFLSGGLRGYDIRDRRNEFRTAFVVQWFEELKRLVPTN
jgi:hypothetical protein